MDMQTIGIKELQTNPALLTKTLESKEYMMFTKHSKPIGLAISFDDRIVTEGLKTALMIDAFKNGLLSLGQLSKGLEKSTQETLKMLSAMGMDVIDYDFDDDLKAIETLV
jgi:predicted HTH domain antitoxin